MWLLWQAGDQGERQQFCKEHCYPQPFRGENDDAFMEALWVGMAGLALLTAVT